MSRNTSGHTSVAPPELVQSISQVLNDTQMSLAAHKKCMTRMNKLYDEWAPDNDAAGVRQFAAAFVACLRRVLVVFKREKAVDRILEFASKFLAEHCEGSAVEGDDNGEASLHAQVTLFLVRNSSVKDKAVRYRCAQLLSLLMNNLPDEAEIDDNLWDSVIEEMLTRTNDRVPCVKTAAIAALCRLQDPTDPADPVVERYKSILDGDACKDARRIVVESIGVSKGTLAFILDRTRDVSAEVRRAAYAVLQAKVPLHSLTIAQRCQLAEAGLKDRDNKVKSVAHQMVCENWFMSEESDFVRLLELFDVEENEDTALLLVKALLKHGAEPTKIDFQNGNLELTVEKALYWRACVEHYTEAAARVDEETLEAWLPDPATLGPHILKWHAQPFIQKCLLLIATKLEFEEGGRRLFSTLLANMLIKLQSDVDLIAPMNRVFELLHPTAAEYCPLMLDIVQQVSAPLSDTHAMAKAAAAAAAVVDEAADADDEAAAYAEQIEGTWARTLCLLTHLLHNTPAAQLEASPDVAESHLALIRRAVSNANPLVREEAIAALGAFCALDEAAAQAHAPLFSSVLANDLDEIKEVALKALADIVLVFGETVVDDTPAVAQIQALMAHDDQALRTLAVEAFAKMLLSGRITTTPTRLSECILLLYSPETEADAKLRQILSAFLPAFSFSSPFNQLALANAAAPTLRKLTMGALPHNDPLLEINVEELAMYLCDLCDEHKLVDGASARKEMLPSTTSGSGGDNEAADSAESYASFSPHSILARFVAMEVLVAPEGPHVKVWCKVASYLHLRDVGGPPLYVAETLFLIEECMGSLVGERTLISQLTKAKTQLVKEVRRLPGGPPTLTDAQIEALRAPVRAEVDKRRQLRKSERSRRAAESMAVALSISQKLGRDDTDDIVPLKTSGATYLKRSLQLSKQILAEADAECAAATAKCATPTATGDDDDAAAAEKGIDAQKEGSQNNSKRSSLLKTSQKLMKNAAKNDIFSFEVSDDEGDDGDDATGLSASARRRAKRNANSLSGRSPLQQIDVN